MLLHDHIITFLCYQISITLQYCVIMLVQYSTAMFTISLHYLIIHYYIIILSRPFLSYYDIILSYCYMGVSDKPSYEKWPDLDIVFPRVVDLRYCCTERIGTYNFTTKSLKRQAERNRNVLERIALSQNSERVAQNVQERIVAGHDCVNLLRGLHGTYRSVQFQAMIATIYRECCTERIGTYSIRAWAQRFAERVARNVSERITSEQD